MTAPAVRRGGEPKRQEARDRAHPCPVTGCPRLVSEGHVACLPHYRTLPVRTRRSLAAIWRAPEQHPHTYEAARRLVALLVQEAA